MVVDGALVFVEGVVVRTGTELNCVIDRVALEGADSCIFKHFAEQLVCKLLAEETVIVHVVDHPRHSELDIANLRNERIHDRWTAAKISDLAGVDIINEDSGHRVALDFDMHLVLDFPEVGAVHAFFPCRDVGANS